MNTFSPSFDTQLADGDFVVITPRNIRSAAPEDYLSVPEIARDLHMSPATVRGLIRSGELKAFNKRTNGLRFGVLKADYEEFLADRKKAMRPILPADGSV